MPELMQQWRFLDASFVTANDITNTWHFRTVSDPPSAATLTAIESAVATFYNAFASSIPSAYWTNSPIVKTYNLADPEPRAPITNQVHALGAFYASTSNLPRENCMVMSYAAAQLSGTPMGRRRGRVYLPTFNFGAMAANGVWANGTVDSVATAANALLTASTSAGDWDWVVHSEVLGTSAVVTHVWADNAPDIQRRRGVKPNYRKNLP